MVKAPGELGLYLARCIAVEENVMTFNMTRKPLIEIHEDSLLHRTAEQIVCQISIRKLK